MEYGKIKFYNEEKGFGFIKPDNGGDDVFVHRTALENSGITNLQENTPVTYELVEDRKNGKIKADNVKV